MKIKLKPCPFCGDVKDLQILNQGDLVGYDCHYDCPKEKESTVQLAHDWFVNCPSCGACGPDFFPHSEESYGPKTDDECKEEAVEAWNRRDEEE